MTLVFVDEHIFSAKYCGRSDGSIVRPSRPAAIHRVHLEEHVEVGVDCLVRNAGNS